MMEKLRRQLRVLSKTHSLEIIGVLYENPTYISDISGKIGSPYATTQQRVVELMHCDLVEVFHTVDEFSRRPIKMVRIKNFRISMSPQTIKTMLSHDEKDIVL